MKKIQIDDVELTLAHPEEKASQWIGQEELLEQILACWTVLSADDLPLCPRLVGRPGVGKTTLAYAAAKTLERPVYIFQCTADTRPEDLIVTPVIAQSGKITYHASGLLSAAIQGGIAILDEANRMSEKSWASLAPLLDTRRYVESIVAGIKVQAHPDFRCCVTMNDDASTFEIPDYMLSRIQPMIEIGFPDPQEEMRILKYNLPFAPEELLQMTVDFLQQGHQHNLGYTPRDGINIIRFTLKRQSRNPDSSSLDDLFKSSVEQILGPDAFDFRKAQLADMARQQFVNFDEFFTSSTEWMNEDEDENDNDEDDKKSEERDP